jgi:hypothetical protein
MAKGYYPNLHLYLLTLQGLNYAQYAQLQRELKRVREQLAVEKARNSGKPAKAQDGEDGLVDSSLSMAVVSHNASLRANKRNDQTAALAQNEHVRRLEALLNQLKSYETIEDERRRLRESNSHLKEQCASKDKYIHSARMIIKLREATIESLQKKTTTRTGTTSNQNIWRGALNRWTWRCLLIPHPNEQGVLRSRLLSKRWRTCVRWWRTTPTCSNTPARATTGRRS